MSDPEIVRDMIGEAEALELQATRLNNGTTLVDAGVNVPGSLEAGRLFAEVCLGGLGKVLFCEISYGGLSFPAVRHYGRSADARMHGGSICGMGCKGE